MLFTLDAELGFWKGFAVHGVAILAHVHRFAAVACRRELVISLFWSME